MSKSEPTLLTSGVRKYVALFDTHYGFERKNRHKRPLHDPKAVDATMTFVEDFKPDVVILGGDILDCGAISHHNRNKPGRIEGLRVEEDASLLQGDIIGPLTAIGSQHIYIIGNHEAWLDDLVEDQPGLTGAVGLERMLDLKDWTVVPQGDYFELGKLTFLHGDQIKGGEHVAKVGVIAAERNIRFGHWHTYQVYTKASFCDTTIGRTGVAVPCLCRKNPAYGESAPNKWVQGFNYGYVFDNGNFTDYVPIIAGGQFVAEGKIYRG